MNEVIRFRHVKQTKGMIVVGMVTICEVMSAAELTGCYIVPEGQFNRQNSRKCAFANALRCLTKSEREFMWNIYFQIFPDRPSRLQKQVRKQVKEKISTMFRVSMTR